MVERSGRTVGTVRSLDVRGGEGRVKPGSSGPAGRSVLWTLRPGRIAPASRDSSEAGTGARKPGACRSSIGANVRRSRPVRSDSHHDPEVKHLRFRSRPSGRRRKHPVRYRYPPSSPRRHPVRYRYPSPHPQPRLDRTPSPRPSQGPWRESLPQPLPPRPPQVPGLPHLGLRRPHSPPPRTALDADVRRRRRICVRVRSELDDSRRSRLRLMLWSRCLLGVSPGIHRNQRIHGRLAGNRLILLFRRLKRSLDPHEGGLSSAVAVQEKRGVDRPLSRPGGRRQGVSRLTFVYTWNFAFRGGERGSDRRTWVFGPDKFARTDLNPGRGRAQGFGNGLGLPHPPLTTLGFHRTRFGIGSSRLSRLDHEIGPSRGLAPFAAVGRTFDPGTSPFIGEFFAANGPCLRLPGAAHLPLASSRWREQDQRHQGKVGEQQPNRDRSHGKAGQDHQHNQRPTPDPRGNAGRRTLVRSRWQT